jgi:GT2 family glycosyltransferase
MELSIIIVNWNSVKFLQACLTSIYACVEGISFEVLVIDNASWDGCMEMLAEDFPAVHAIQSEENTGFAKANNRCFEQSRGENILFLNPDTEILGPAIQTMLRFLQESPSAGIVGAKLLNSDFSIQTSCIQRFPTALNQLLDFDYLRKAFPSADLWGTAPLASDIATPVEVVSGACLMIRRDVFLAAGKFDEGYFMYSEDVDLCFQVRKQGRGNYFVPQAQVVHHGGRSSKATSQR